MTDTRNTVYLRTYSSMIKLYIYSSYIFIRGFLSLTQGFLSLTHGFFKFNSYSSKLTHSFLSLTHIPSS